MARKRMSNHEVLTVKEAADLLRISEIGVRRLADQGEIPARRVGKRWRFSRTALEAFIRGSQPKRGAA